MRHRLRIVGIHIQRIRTACLLQTRPCARHNGQPATDGLDDGDAEALVTRGIHKRLRLCIEFGQFLVAHPVHDPDTVAQSRLLRIRTYLVGIGRVPAHDHQFQFLGQIGQCLHRQQDVLPRLYRPHAQDIAFTAFGR